MIVNIYLQHLAALGFELQTLQSLVLTPEPPSPLKVCNWHILVRLTVEMEPFSENTGYRLGQLTQNKCQSIALHLFNCRYINITKISTESNHHGYWTYVYQLLQPLRPGMGDYCLD